MKKHFFTILLFITLFSCANSDLFESEETTITGSIELDKDTYDYNETISGTISINEYEIDDLTIEFTLNDSSLTLPVNGDGTFELTLTPDTTTDYTLNVTVTYGSTVKTFTYDFIVSQIPFLGTWRAYNVYTPPYSSAQYDIIGVWYIDGFELYYVDPNNDDNLLTYSAKGTMEFPTEDTWLTLTEKYYYDESSSEWLDWVYNDGIMYAKYNYTNGLIEMDVSLDLTSPADTAEYTWSFEKISDSVTPLY